jgi:DDE superfamily endonuclease
MVVSRRSLRRRLLLLQAQAITAAFVMTVIAIRYKQKAKRQLRKAGWRGPARTRNRVSMQEVFNSLGPNYFRRSFRMSYDSFKKLLGILTPGIRLLTRKPGTDCSVLQRAPNGTIAPAQRLGCYLRIAAGASVYDVMLVFGIGRADVSKSIWVVTQAINQCRAFEIAYPTCHEAQRGIADGFNRKSAADFRCCAGALDGILIWTHRPSEADAAQASCDVGKFFCGRKHKFGLNMQAICDARGRFLDVSLMFPASTSDILSFESASIYQKLQDGLLAPGMYYPLSLLFSHQFTVLFVAQDCVCSAIMLTLIPLFWQHRTVVQKEV